jgi:metal-responsive CopG/Arc/MetJ family transcriptional regulator
MQNDTQFVIRLPSSLLRRMDEALKRYPELKRPSLIRTLIREWIQKEEQKR